MSNAMQFKARVKNLALKNHVPAQAVLQRLSYANGIPFDEVIETLTDLVRSNFG